MTWDLQPSTRLAWSGVFAVFVLRFVLTPVTVSWQRYEIGHFFITWRSLYIFGVRVARWNVTNG